MRDIDKDFVHLVQLSLAGKMEDVGALAKQSLKAILDRRPDLAQSARATISMLSRSVHRSTASLALPVDADSRLELLRREPVPEIPVEPTWPPSIKSELDAVVKEREMESDLLSAGLVPTRSLLLVGPPGVGKTLAARWLARRIQRPLLTLDLAAVMSSFLGRTGNNIRVVLDFARNDPNVLLLDEFDAIAKRRDDVAEVGELKRLVTVLLQAVDEWPAQGMLLAATNHPELLDRAVWRRFDKVIRFPLPEPPEIRDALSRLFDHTDIGAQIEVLTAFYVGRSFADMSRDIAAVRRAAVVGNESLSEALGRLTKQLSLDASRAQKISAARHLAEGGASQREISSLTGLSRDTIRKYGRAKKG